MALKFKTEFFNYSEAVSFSEKILRGEINKCHRKRNVTFFDLLKCQFCKFELKILELFSVEQLKIGTLTCPLSNIVLGIF